MALQIWLPLNGNLENKGLNNVNINNTGATIDNNGKIGKCMKITSVVDTGFVPNLNTSSLSLCGWFKFNLSEINTAVSELTYTSNAHSPTGNLIGNISYGGIGIIWEGNKVYDSGSLSHLYVLGTFRIPAGGWYLPRFKVEFDTWTHITLTWNILTQTLSIYKNGELINNLIVNTTFNDAISRTLRINFNAVYGGNGPTTFIPIYANDIRIYDHCLSPKEVKEISLGLVLHYKFNDLYLESTTNLATYPTPVSGYYPEWDASKHPDAITVSGWGVGYNSGVNNPSQGYHAYWKIIDGIPTMVFQDLNSVISSAHRWLGIAGGISGTIIPSNTTYTVSFDAKADTDSKRIASALYYRSTSDENYSFKDGLTYIDIDKEWKRYSYTKTTQTVDNISGLYVYGHYGTSEGTSYVRNILIELKDHATPYTFAARGNNLITGIVNGGQTSISGNTISITGNNSDTYFCLNISKPMISGKTYKISCTGNFSNGIYYNFPIAAQSNTGPGVLKIQNGYCEMIFIANDICLDSGKRILMDDGGRNPGAGTITDIKLEELLTVYDCSGYGHDGVVKGNLLINNDTPRHSYSILSSDTTTNSVITTELNLPDGPVTLAFWSKPTISTTTDDSKIDLTFSKSRYFTYLNYPYFTHDINSSYKYTNYWLDNKWHFVNGVYDGTNVNLYIDGNLIIGYQSDSSTTPYRNTLNLSFKGNSISDLRIYATALSELDIKELYNTAALVDNSGNLYGYEFNENHTNLAFGANYGIISKQFIEGLNKYTLSNCLCTLTDNGYRIYRTPNVNPTDNGNTMWGGFILDNIDNRFNFEDGHTYIIEFDVSGQSSNIAGFTWTNNVGWSGGGLVPYPSGSSYNNPVTTDFNSPEWKHFFYKWTINDGVYKECTTSYSTFVQGTTYLSYRGFKFGFVYTDTGPLGTDLYIKNLSLYDITNNVNIDILKTGIIKVRNFVEEYKETNFQFSGAINSTQIIEI